MKIHVTPHPCLFRVDAPIECEKVELSIDGEPWKLCRYASGSWWCDWFELPPGKHEAKARAKPIDGALKELGKRNFWVS